MNLEVSSPVFLQGGGELGELTRSFDWSSTSVGETDQWPQSLRTTVSMILSSRFPMFLWWGDDLIQFYNDAYRPSLGNEGKHPKALGQKGNECWPEIWDIIYPLIKLVLTKGEATWSEDQLVPIYRNGRLEDVYWTFGYSPIRGESDKVEGVLVVCTETTEKVNNFKNLESAHQQFKNMVRQAPVAIAVFRGEDFIAEIANNFYLPLVGKTGEEFIGKPLFDSLPEVRHSIEPIARRVVASGIPYIANEFELMVRRNNRVEKCYFNYVYEPLRLTNGEIDGFIAVAHEVTDQVNSRKKVEEAERSFRETILKAPVAMCLLTGPNNMVEIANDLMLQIWGKSKEEILRKPLFEGLPEVKDQGFDILLKNVYDTGEPYVAQDIPVSLPRNGHMETVYVNFVYAPNRKADGTVSGILAVAIDVTAQVIARQKIEEVVEERTKELANANIRLLMSNEELAQYAHIASHDLQEPARKIRTFSQLLEENLGVVNVDAQKYLHKINNSAERMIALIRDVLAYSELSNKNREYSKVNLQHVFYNIKQDYELLLEQKQANIECTGLPTIEAIPIQMVQLFGNLISNALKFCSAEIRPELKIRSRKLSLKDVQDFPFYVRDKTYHLIEFMDNGIGISPEDAKKVFNIFKRLHGRNEYSGTGMGLAICKKIAENHGGSIDATGTPGHGMTISVILPEEQ